jgi:hypothetical protein
MLRITADVFSGQTNPEWIVTDEQEAKATLKELLKERSLISANATAQAGLGFRGLMIEILSDDLARSAADLPMTMYLAAGPEVATSRSSELAQRLIDLMAYAEPSSVFAAEAPPLDDALKTFLSQQLEREGRVSMLDTNGPQQAASSEEAQEKEQELVTATCQIEFAAYNPGFWNNDATVRSRNNCYNYASNKRTDTFAQPGRGCGRIYTAITCAEVTRAALCDGLHRRFDCFPSSEAPRYLVALVVAPGPGFIDFHWYRKMKEGYWAHKPGGTAVRNVDNSGRVISDPATCDRGPYRQFCGYFYTCKSQRIR